MILETVLYSYQETGKFLVVLLVISDNLEHSRKIRVISNFSFALFSYGP